MNEPLPAIFPPNLIFYRLSIGFCTQSAAHSIEVVANLIEQITTSKSAQPLNDADPQDVLDELQNIVVQGAAISRYFWPVRDAHTARGLELRKMYNIREDSPLRSRDLRNTIEHFDERLDNYLARGIVGKIIPHYLGPEPTHSDVPRHFFRAYFINTQVFEMLGQRYEIEPLAAELGRLAGGRAGDA